MRVLDFVVRRAVLLSGRGHHLGVLGQQRAVRRADFTNGIALLKAYGLRLYDGGLAARNFRHFGVRGNEFRARFGRRGFRNRLRKLGRHSRGQRNLRRVEVERLKRVLENVPHFGGRLHACLRQVLLARELVYSVRRVCHLLLQRSPFLRVRGGVHLPHEVLMIVDGLVEFIHDGHGLRNAERLEQPAQRAVHVARVAMKIIVARERYGVEDGAARFGPELGQGALALLGGKLIPRSGVIRDGPAINKTVVKLLVLVHLIRAVRVQDGLIIGVPRFRV